MPRPASRASGKKKGKKEKKKTPKQQIAELTEANTQLTEELTNLKTEYENTKDKLGSVVLKILEGVKRKDFAVKESTDILDISTDTLRDMVGKMTLKKKIHEVSVEARADELEARVTSMSLELARMTKKTVAYETGLQSIIQSDCEEEMRDKAYQLQMIAGKQYHTFSYVDPATTRIEWMNGVLEEPDLPIQKLLDSAQKFNLVPPKKKLPGETPIRSMHGELKLFIMKELSQEKSSGADWRMIAGRVGIDQETIDYWHSLKLDCPMGRVFSEWEEQPSATVRLLHRHLLSPQLRCAILAKRVSDFYDVN